MKKILIIMMVTVIMLPIFASDKAPEFKLENLKGKIVKLSDFQKEGLVILDFWATWCAPCKKALPKMSKLHEKYDNVNVVTICTDKPRKVSAAKKLVKSQKYKFHTLFDTKGTVRKLYNINNIPRTIIISPDGTIIYDHTGYQEGDEKKLEKVITGWMNAKTMIEDKKSTLKKKGIGTPLGKVEKKEIVEEKDIKSKKEAVETKLKKPALKISEKEEEVDPIGKVEDRIKDKTEEEEAEEAGDK